jgi:hypothetical protein
MPIHLAGLDVRRLAIPGKEQKMKNIFVETHEVMAGVERAEALHWRPLLIVGVRKRLSQEDPV